MPSPYSAKFKYDREKTIYGFVVNRKNGKHYCFNRDYLCLPVQLPPSTLKHLKEIAMGSVRPGKAGHGLYAIEDIGPDEDCEVIFIFNDASAPSWKKASYEYDRSKYE